MLAKAVAGEAGVPFYRLAGAAMTSMFVGATTQRIQTFFANVKKDLPTTDSPAVVFIDEIDGIATERGGKQASDKDRNSALTQLLHEIGEMHDKYPNVVIIGATNRFDELDNALKRAGRLGTHITMPNPDLLARLDILRENAGKLKLEGVELETIAELTAGLSGASVAAVPPAAAKVARKRGGKGTPANRHDFERAAMETVMGMLRTKRFVSAENQRIAAAHESGHSVLAYASPHHQLLITTTYPIKESGGSTWFAAGDRMVHTADSILWDVAVSMGGRAGEVIDQRRPSTGCGHDVQQATRLVLAVICAGGVYDDFITEVDVRNWQDHPLAGKISEKVQEVLAEGMKLAQETLLKHAAYRSAIQEELLDKRILHSDELAALALAHRAEGTDPTT
jgi:cell division protease FtsH